MANEAWRAAHPERARTLGGHDAEPFDRRLADALIALVGAQSDTGSSCVHVYNYIGNVETRRRRRARQREQLLLRQHHLQQHLRQHHRRQHHRRQPRRRCGANAGGSHHSGAPGGLVGRPTVVVTISAETLESEIVGLGPISFTEAAALAARADLYAAVHSSTWAILNFGRNRRLASPLQRLAAIVRDRCCIADGCNASYDRCDLHHEPPWEEGGRTNLDELELVCTTEHHSHRHTTGAPRTRRMRPVERPGMRENAEAEVCPWSDDDIDAEFAALTDEARLGHRPNTFDDDLPDVFDGPDEEPRLTQAVGW